MNATVSRRTAIKTATATAAAVTASLSAGVRSLEAASLKGNINHSVCRWCYNKIPLEDLCKAAKAIGLKSIELQGPKQWPTLKKYGLTCAIGSGAGMGISRGFNRVELHDQLVASFEELIPKAAEAGLTNVICMSGNRGGIDDEEGIENCAKGLKRLMKLAEEKKINVVTG